MPDPRRETDWIQVVAAVLTDRAGRVLISRRPPQSHQGGLWEFPGGKLEPGESAEAGLARELAEELGIGIGRVQPLIRVPHDYGDRRIVLDVYRVLDHTGSPRGREGQLLAWLAPEAMDAACFPAADRPVITALRLPRLMLITGPDPRAPRQFLAKLECALAGGIRLVQLRAPELISTDYRRLAAAAWELCSVHGALLVLNRHPAEVKGLRRHGLHLTSRLLLELHQRPGGADELTGASCHNPSQLRRTSELGLDYALLSPVRPTASHPQVQPLGWQTFADWVAPVPLPVYALGGLTADDLETAIQHGAQGIAAIRSLWPGDCKGLETKRHRILENSS